MAMWRLFIHLMDGIMGVSWPGLQVTVWLGVLGVLDFCRRDETIEISFYMFESIL
jgi:hypothetical protein